VQPTLNLSPLFKISSWAKCSVVVAMHIQVTEAMFGALTASQLGYVMKQRGEVEIKVGLCSFSVFLGT